MPGAYLWAWDEDAGAFVKVAVDSEGRFRTVNEVDELGNIGDVTLTDIADDDVIYWDEAAGKWKNIAHLGVASAHHTKYTNSNAVSAMGAKADDNPLHHDRTVKYTNSEAVSAVEAAGLALASGKNIKVISALTADHTWSGLTSLLLASPAFAIGEVAYIGAIGTAYLARALSTTTMPAMAIATATIEASAYGEFLLIGYIRNNAWGWTPGGLLYVSEDTSGALTQTLPAAPGEQVQVVGVAMSADIIYFNPSYELVEIS